MGFVQDLKDAIFPPERETDPPWAKRLKAAAYNSPSGQRFVLTYENVSYEFDNRGTAFGFPGVDGTYVQRKSRSSFRYPMRLFFWGDDYDRESEEFEKALQEDGFGILEHPMYGTHDVIPFGRITRRDDLKTAANQAIFEIVFWETITELYPFSEEDAQSEIEEAIDLFNDAVSGQFDIQIDLDTAIERISVLDKFNTFLDRTSAVLGVIADAQADVGKQFDAIVSSINRGIDVLVGTPLALARQTQLMIQAPSRAFTSITAKLDAYGNLAADIFGATDAVASPNTTDSQNTNAFHTGSIYAAGYVSGSVLSVLNTEFETKPQALQAAEDVLAQMDAYVAWSEENYASISQTADDTLAVKEVDTGDAYQQLQQAVALTVGFLIQVSFSAKQERAIVLDRDRSIIDLTAELYQDVPDSHLDFLIATNDLTGSEILELPRGKRIVYYV